MTRRTTFRDLAISLRDAAARLLWPSKSTPSSNRSALASKALRRSLATVVAVGFGIGVLLCGSLAVWASRAPLASAAVASGNVSPDSGRRVIQHLEGGIIRAINVTDGQVVKEGQVLYTLEPIQARAQFASKRQQWLRLQVTRARLEAHLRGDSEFAAPTFAESETDAGFKKFAADQVLLFYIRRKSLSEREQILRQQLLQLDQQTSAKKKENESLDKQQAFLEDEIADKKDLIAKNLARKPEWLALERSRADIMGRIDSNLAEVARIAERAGEIKLSILTSQTQFEQDASDQLTKTNSDIAQLEETLPASEDVLRRTDIVAPVDGTVFNLRFKTIGGVVRPGEALLDIEPQSDDLIIDAKLSPNDIDVVRPGLPAEVYLTPYVSRHTPRLKGTVMRVSPDIMREGSPGGAQPGSAGASGPAAMPSYYEVKVRIDRHEFSGLAEDLRLFPGMPAEVYIMTGSRTFAQYFTDPLLKSFRRAFREK
ncbi:MAG: HlyD family type I secretion periplasmic adaptor subunit [Pseudolabrys sp.]